MRHPFNQKIVLIFSGIFLFFVLLEAILRLGGFILLSAQELRNRHSLKQKGAYRVMCLGESTTQGQYPPFLEQALNQQGRGISFSVIDKGTAGQNTDFILSQVEAYLAQYHPDMVVAMMGVNDSGEYIPLETQADHRKVSLIESLKIYKLARIFWLHLSAKAKDAEGSKNDPGKPPAYPQENPPKDNFTQNNLKKDIKKEADNKSIAESVEFYRKLGQYSQAENILKQAIGLDPKNSDLYIELGWLYHQVSGKSSPQEGAPFGGQALAKAEEAFKKAAELDPANGRAYAQLGRLYQEQGKYTQAEKMFRQAIENNFENERVFGGLSVIYAAMNKADLAGFYAQKAGKSSLGTATAANYFKLKNILDKNAIKLVCVQYPMRNVRPLKKIFENEGKKIIFVDNEKVFRDLVKRDGAGVYFVDMFGGDFGHCTEKGNRVLARNIAGVILKEVFNQ